MAYRIVGLSVLGNHRRQSEDRLVIAEAHGLCAVVDGSGAGGLVAEALAQHLRALQARTSIHEADVVSAIRAAESDVHEAISARPELKGCGATFLGGLVIANVLRAFHAGDCRLYRFGAGGLAQLSKDHTWVTEEVAAGRLTFEEAALHPLNSVVTRALGGTFPLLVDLITTETHPGEKYLFCTDGLWRELSDDSIESILAQSEAEEALERLLFVRGSKGSRRSRCSDDGTVAIITASPRTA